MPPKHTRLRKASADDDMSAELSGFQPAKVRLVHATPLEDSAPWRDLQQERHLMSLKSRVQRARTDAKQQRELLTGALERERRAVSQVGKVYNSGRTRIQEAQLVLQREREEANARLAQQDAILQRLHTEAAQREQVFLARIDSMQVQLDAKTADERQTRKIYADLMAKAEETERTVASEVARVHAERESTLLQMEQKHRLEIKVS